MAGITEFTTVGTMEFNSEFTMVDTTAPTTVDTIPYQAIRVSTRVG